MFLDFFVAALCNLGFAICSSYKGQVWPPLLYENTKPIEHALLRPTCVRFHLMCACKHCNVKSPVYYWTHWSCWWVYHFKRHRFYAIFIIKPGHTGRLKKQIWVEKTLSGNPGHVRQNAFYGNLKRTFEDLLPCYCYAMKTNSTTIR